MEQDIEKLVEHVRQVAYALHVYLGTGLLERGPSGSNGWVELLAV